jgi:predicted secreted protein
MAFSGRELRISRSGTPVALARSDDLTLSFEAVDVTNKDSAGWRTLLPVAGVKSVTYTIAVASVAALSGTFKMASLANNGNHDGAVEFTASLESSGAVLVLVNTIAPAVTGTPAVGQTLTTTNGTWLGSPTFARQWQRSSDGGATWSNIASATGLTYVPATAGQLIRSRVTATTAYGTAIAFSNIVGPIAA